MKRGVLLFVLMLFAVSSSAANMVAKDSAGNRVTLRETPCVAAPWLKEWQNATMFYQGKTYEACWRLQGETVVVLDSAGDITPLPVQVFARETEV